MNTQKPKPEHDKEYAARFVGAPGEMIVDGKIFVNGEWVELGKYREWLKKNER